MKISLVASIVILAVATRVGWQDRQRLASSRERNARAISQAAALGISPGAPGKTQAIVVTKLGRETGAEAAKREVAELFALMKKVDAQDDSDEKAGEQALEKMFSLGPEATELLIREVLADKELKEETRGGILGVMLSKLANDSPQAILRLLPDLKGDLWESNDGRKMRDYLLGTSLTNWAKEDVRAVGKWIGENGEKYPGAINDSIKCGLLASSAAADPSLALDLIDEMGIGDKHEAVILISRSAKGPEKRTAMLGALRSHFSQSPEADPKGEGMRAAVGELVLSNFGSGFGPATQWLEGARLEPSEMAMVGVAISFNHTYKETGLWLDWLGKNLSADQADRTIGRLMTKWTELDYQEAGKWLTTAPEGRARIASVRAYATAVSKYEPATAAQWAMTLPAGKDRDATIRQIHQNWPKEQADARAVFAKEHGIE